ncbi:cell wall elongation regulator TseB-like domain-containing protein [Paenibacillus chitinolyticus]|uniref:cell wall elongation regulator TseB-like domain-containing protein n=1 Tax=Paenibacillus chitinolyticus TaxID=79263 RepID=UPI00365FED40
MLKKAIWIGLFVVLTSGFGINRFYVNVQANHWERNSEAVQAAYEKTTMTKANRVEAFHGARSYEVVYGEDKLGNGLIVWVPLKQDGTGLAIDEIHTEMTAENITEEAVRGIMAKKNAKLDILRINAGEFKGKYVWEVFYKDEQDRAFYDYYNLKTGALEDTFKLSLQ